MSNFKLPSPRELREKQSKELRQRTDEFRRELKKQMDNWTGDKTFTLRGTHQDRIVFENLMQELPEWHCKIETALARFGGSNLLLKISFPPEK